MTIRKKVAIGILLAVMPGAFVCLVACEAGGPLDTPQNVRVEDETLIWDEVEGAEGYIVEIDGEAREVETNEVSMFTVMIEPRAYEVRVQAYGALDGPKDNSAWSETLSYTPQIAKSSGFGLRLTEDGTGYEIGAADSSVMQGKLVLPSAYGDKPIVGVVDNGFKDCTGLTGVLMPDSITELGANAFAGCTSLKYVLCPQAAEIGDFAFSNCTSLRRIELPQRMGTLSSYVLNNCTSLEEITLREGLLEIGTGAFSGCTSLKSLHIPASVTEIGAGITRLCRSLTKLDVAEGNAVYRSEGNCIILRENDELVRGCAGSVIPASVRTIGDRAFSNCDGLTEITIPGNVKSVGENAFGFSSDLRAVHIEEGVEEIGGKNVGGVFYTPGVFNGSALEELEIPTSVRYLSGDLTAYCAELTSLTVAEGNAVYYSENNCILRKEDKEVVAGCKTSAIPQAASGIGSYAFSGIPLTAAVIPEGVTEIGESAFRESSLESVELPSSLRAIGASAFEESGLEYIAIPESVQEIGGKAFYKCYFLTAVLPGSVEKIGAGAFSFATIYTTSSREEPEGWYKKDPMLGQIRLDYDWDMGSCAVVYDCTFGYDGGAPYVLTYTVLDGGESGRYNVHMGSYPYLFVFIEIPCREGYVFRGWATEEGGDAVYGMESTTATIKEEDGSSVSYHYYYSLTYEMLAEAGHGTVLYAIWEKAE